MTTREPRSSIDPRDEAYRLNRSRMLLLLDEVLAAQARAIAGEGGRDTWSPASGGRRRTRERVDLLLDRDSPFLELSPLAGWGTDDPVGGGLVVGIGLVEGTECLVVADDGATRRASRSPTRTAKARRAREIARHNRLPQMVLVESDEPEGGTASAAIGPFSTADVPVVTVVSGPAPARPAHALGPDDHVVLVHEGGTGGRADTALDPPGWADVVARDETDALRQARLLLRRARHHRGRPHPGPPADPPVLDPDELLGIPSEDPAVPVDVREVLWRVLDGSELDEFKPGYGPALITGWGSLGGFPVGVVADNGALTSSGTHKGAQFVQVCNRRDLPLLFVHQVSPVTGSLAAQQADLADTRGPLAHAVALSTVPHLLLTVGPSQAGGGDRPGPAGAARFAFSWPNHRRVPADRADGDEADPGASTGASPALVATGRLDDDGVIDPRDTRLVLGVALSCAHRAPVEGSGSFGALRW